MSNFNERSQSDKNMGLGQLRMHGVVAAFLATAACGGHHPTRPGATQWSVPTQYLVTDFPREAIEDLPKLLADYGFIAEPSEKPETFRFELSRIATMDDLRAVQDRLVQWSREHKKPLTLQAAQMIFASVEGTADTTLILRGEATVGADVEVDLGGRQSRSPAVSAGHWKLEVTTDEQNAVETRRDGWVYVKQTKNGTTYFFRKRLVGTRIEPITRDELPGDSPLRSSAPGPGPGPVPGSPSEPGPM